MSNKVAPTPANIHTSDNPLMDYLRTYVDSKLCYHSDTLKTAQFITRHSRFAYQIDSWTLMDRRELKKNVKNHTMVNQLHAQCFPIYSIIALNYQIPY